MATLQPGEMARMYALGGIMRGGASRGGYVSSRVFISIDGVHVGFGGTPGDAHVGTLIGSLSIRDELDEVPNTCTFRVNGTVAATGGEVVVTLGSKNSVSRLFAGFALTVQQLYVADRPANVQADVNAVDYTWFFDFPKVTKHYRSLSASAIAADLVASYAAGNGFTAAAVAPNLPQLDELTYTNEDLAAAFTRLARRIGGYWYVDYQKQVHLFLDETASNPGPEPLTPQHRSLADFQKAASRTQVLTRVYVEGRGATLMGPVAAGETKLPLTAVDMFAVASDVFLKVSPQGSAGGAYHLSFGGVVTGGAGSLVGPGVGPPGALTATLVQGTGLSVGTYNYAYTDVTANGETLPSPLATLTIGAVVPPPTVAPNPTHAAAGGLLGAGVYSWAYTHVTAGGGETTPSPAAALDTRVPITPTGGIAHINDYGGGPFPSNTRYNYAVTYIGNAGGETSFAPMTYGFLTGSLAPTHFAELFIGKGAGDGWSPTFKCPPGISGIKVYRTHAGGVGQPNQVPHYFVGNATVQSDGAGSLMGTFQDFVPDNALGPIMPGTNTALTAMGTARIYIPVAPPPCTDRKLYRTAVNAPQLRLVGPIGNTLDYGDDGQTDSALGASPPTTNTAGAESRAAQLSQIAAGPPGTTSRRVYRTAVNGAQLKLLVLLADNTTTTASDTAPDASLGANAPTGDTSGLQQVPGQVPAGATTLVVANVAPFETDGWAVIGNGEQVIRYTGKTGNALTGIPAIGIGAIIAGVAYNSTVTAAPMLTGIPTSGARSIQAPLTQGDEIYLVVQRDDTARQTAVADMVNVGPGIREEWVQDRRLSITEARARGDATLALRPLEEVTITYRCRDLRTASGKTITVNLPAPTNVFGTFKIQAVTIDNFRPFPTQYPTYTVTASTNRFSFEDWLRRMQTQE
jgi:hypothetical protein